MNLKDAWSQCQKLPNWLRQAARLSLIKHHANELNLKEVLDTLGYKPTDEQLETILHDMAQGKKADDIVRRVLGEPITCHECAAVVDDEDVLVEGLCAGCTPECEGCGETGLDLTDGVCEVCKEEQDLEAENEMDYERNDPDSPHYLIDGVGFADPGGNSALRAATRDNPRNLPCPNCERPNRLTPADRARGYQCDSCADALERGGP